MSWTESVKEDKMNLILIKEDIWESIIMRVSSGNQEKFLSIHYSMPHWLKTKLILAIDQCISKEKTSNGIATTLT